MPRCHRPPNPQPASFQAIGHYRGVTAATGAIVIGSADTGTYSLTSGVESCSVDFNVPKATLIIWLACACSSNHQAPSAGGSAAGSAVAVVAAPQPLDAPPAPAQIDASCNVGDGYVRCMVAPVGAPLPGKHCWRALVSVEDHLEATAEIVTSDIACTTDLAVTPPMLLDLPHARGVDLEDTCASLDGCTIVLVGEAAVAAETKKLDDHVIAELTTEKTERQAMLRDDRPIATADWKKLRARYASLSDNPNAPMDYQMRMREPGAEDDRFAGVALRAGDLTKGNLKCALAAVGRSSFAACLVDHAPSGSDATAAGDGLAAASAPPFAFLSERAITPAEVAALSTEDLVLARNEIYARHGYTFKHADLAAYFAKQPWYKADPAYDESSLTAIERDNIRALLVAEKARPK